jgi:mRNA interferase MazF
VITVVPVTSNVSTVYRFQVRIPAGEAGLKVASKAQAEQIRSVDVTRLTTRIGALSPERMAKLDAALRLHLDL